MQFIYLMSSVLWSTDFTSVRSTCQRSFHNLASRSRTYLDLSLNYLRMRGVLPDNRPLTNVQSSDYADL